eukprot:983331-Amphidinium_carterae.2
MRANETSTYSHTPKYMRKYAHLEGVSRSAVCSVGWFGMKKPLCEITSEFAKSVTNMPAILLSSIGLKRTSAPKLLAW